MASKIRLEYRLLDGYHVNKNEAQSLFLVIKERFRGVKPTPEALVKEARKKNSPIHSLRLWDGWNEKIASAKHWRDIAQYYLRSVAVVKVSVKTGKVVSGPVRFSLPVEFDGHRIDRYAEAEDVEKDAVMKASVKSQCLSEYLSWLNRWKRYREFFGMRSQFEEAFSQAERGIKRAG